MEEFLKRHPNVEFKIKWTKGNGFQIDSVIANTIEEVIEWWEEFAQE